MSFLQYLKAVLCTPERGETPYIRAVIGLGHTYVGAAMSAAVTALFGPLSAISVFLIPISYFLVKERRDIVANGDVRDAVEDTVFVGVGGLYAGAIWWPFLSLSLAIFALWLEWRKL